MKNTTTVIPDHSKQKRQAKTFKDWTRHPRTGC